MADQPKNVPEFPQEILVGWEDEHTDTPFLVVSDDAKGANLAEVGVARPVATYRLVRKAWLSAEPKLDPQ